LIPFVVVGEGRPAKAILETILATPGTVVEALAVDDPARSALSVVTAARGITVMGKSAFVGCIQGDRSAGRNGGWLINVNSTLIIPGPVLDLFGERALNFHPGLLPEYAGLHTHQWAIRNGEREFGVTIHRMVRQIDTGAIVGQIRFPIQPDDTGLSLFTHCLRAGIELFARVVGQIVQGETLVDMPQNLSKRRLYRHRDALDGRIDWNWTASGVIDFIRAGNYEPLQSPTYVAQLDPVDGVEINVLRATYEGSTAEPSGTIIDVCDAGPLIACGDRAAIRIARARNNRQLLSLPQWRDYVSRLPGRRLRGRSQAHAPTDPATAGLGSQTFPSHRRPN
jgi:UDP-4-amino-4-deoxy-L-arabinose formyltransferase/UDP-glucuronic acid dehydrogenase (UDP-4-keto-hexauronic acid decarboxylating)